MEKITKQELNGILLMLASMVSQLNERVAALEEKAKSEEKVD